MGQIISVKLIVILLFAGNAAFVLTIIFYRAWRGNPQLAIPKFDIRFSEKWAAGFSHQNTLAEVGWSANCLAVELSRKALVVRTMFPFNLTALMQIYDLEHRIPRDKIKSVRPAEDDDKRVVIEFEFADVEKCIELSLKKRPEFLRAICTSHEHQPVPSGIFT